MPTININKNTFEKIVGKKLPLDKLKDRISYLGTDLENIENNEITVEIFPNRPDMLSVQGFARAFSSFIGHKIGLRKYQVKKSNEKVIIDNSLKNIRPYTACAIVKNLKFDDDKIKEVIQIQEKLHVTYGRNRRKVAIGIYPFEKIKTPIRFLALPPEKIVFQPLEYPTKLNGRQILQKHPTGREYAHLLENYSKYPVFIDANNEVLSMPPIINSHKTGKITEKTKDIFIECSGFDFNILKKCLNIIVTALADMNGTIYSMDLYYGNKKITTPDLKPQEIKLDINYVNKILGLNLKENDIKKYLERMGYSYNNKKALVPCYRTDVLHQIDLVEDIAIAYGFENFKEEIPNISTIAQENDFEKFKNKISNFLIGFNLFEVNTFNLTNKEDQTKNCNLDIDVIEIENPKTSEYNTLRAWMIPSLLNVLRNNKHNEYPQRIFEIGTIFKKNQKKETNVQEDCRLAILLCHKKADYTEIKQILDSLLNSLQLKYTIEETEHSSFIPGRVARISINKEKIAYIGEIHPLILSNFTLETPISALELNLTELYKTKKDKI
ncbi:MAG: phenylalanine--tRNA ligase subunit beta [Candidatus Woesearchaeota archaeon]